MSMEFDTCLFGVIRPAPDSCDGRGKWLKSEPELQSDPELKSELELKSEPKRKPKYEWESKRVEDLEMSDFSMYDDDIKPFMFKCVRFFYRNKAQIKEDEEIRAARAEHKKRSRNLSLFDAIAPPKEANLYCSAVPIPMTNDLRLELTPLCKLALDKYNAENQGANFVFADIVKTTWRPGCMYFITFQAKDACISAVKIFQAQVWNKRSGPPVVKSCAIKPT